MLKAGEGRHDPSGMKVMTLTNARKEVKESSSSLGAAMAATAGV